jgi:hypothetical protein
MLSSMPYADFALISQSFIIAERRVARDRSGRRHGASLRQESTTWSVLNPNQMLLTKTQKNNPCSLLPYVGLTNCNCYQIWVSEGSDHIDSLTGNTNVLSWILRYRVPGNFAPDFVELRPSKTCGRAVCWDTTQQARKSRGWFPIRSLDFSIYRIHPAALWR